MAEREESLGFYEMLWDCDHCDTKGLLGKSQRYCANCGAPQNPDKRYFPKEGEERRIDGHKYEGADRTCAACSAPQSAAAKNCTHCGAPLDGAAEVRGFAAPAPAPRKRRRIWPFVIAVIAIFGFGVWWRCIRKVEKQMTVAAHRWEREIAIEQFDEREEQAWRNEVPADASLHLCHQRQRSTRQVPDGEDCTTERRDKKDGTFEQVKKCKPRYRSVPVDDDWCSYAVRRWKQIDTAKAAGTGMTAAWPTNVPPADAPAQLGAKRSGHRSETLTLDFGNRQTCDVADAVWQKYKDGQKVTVDVRASSSEVVCSSL